MAVGDEDAQPAAPVQDADPEPTPEQRLEVFLLLFLISYLFWFVLTRGGEYVCFVAENGYCFLFLECLVLAGVQRGSFKRTNVLFGRKWPVFICGMTLSAGVR